MKILITGVAGFIGSNLARRLLQTGEEVIGVDNLNDYYDVNLKKSRLKFFCKGENFSFYESDIANSNEIDRIFNKERPNYVVNLAAQAGVRYSIENPMSYIDTNIVGFANILEGCRHYDVEHLVYASSSSVYGANTNMPFSIHNNVDHPLSLYAASKKANELMAHTYSHLYNIPSTGLRFFTVYGPWGRPDMALFKFTKKILSGEPIDVFNYGKHRRDFTYIDDIISGVIKVLNRPASINSVWDGDNPDPATSASPWAIYNIGNNQPTELMKYIETLEDCLGKKAKLNLLPLQLGDVPDTYANVDDLVRDFEFKPNTSIEVGIRDFVDWYMEFYNLKKS